MRDTLIPTKPEDYERRFQTDIKLLKKEVEYILNPDYHQKNIDLAFEDVVSAEMFYQHQKQQGQQQYEQGQQYKCTCPKRIQTTKKKTLKKKHSAEVGTITNGYMMNHYCPIHYHNSNKN